jgi:hypothetical protein
LARKNRDTLQRLEGEFIMIGRLMVGVGLFALGYYLGREMGRTEHIRNRLEQSRTRQPAAAPESPDRDAETDS